MDGVADGGLQFRMIVRREGYKRIFLGGLLADYLMQYDAVYGIIFPTGGLFNLRSFVWGRGYDGNTM